MSDEQPRMSTVLGAILTRPGMYVGSSDNILESIWCFISGFDFGVKHTTGRIDSPELIPKGLLRYIQKELGLQFNDAGIVPRLVEEAGDPEAGLELLKEIIGRYYGCVIDRNNF